jgi:hypothetical protein
MIRLPDNVENVYDQTITLRFASRQECGYVMLYEAGAAKLAHRVIRLNGEARLTEMLADVEPLEGEERRTVEEIAAERQAAVRGFENSVYADGNGGQCLTMTVRDALSLVQPIEQVEELSKMGVRVTAHNFSAQQIAEAARTTLNQFEQSIATLAANAPTMFLEGPAPH